MLSLIKFIVKWSLISFITLTLGNWVQWNGRSLSEIVRITMTPIEKSNFTTDVQQWAKGLTRDARKGFQSRLEISSLPQAKVRIEESLPSERQRLRTLIRELSSSDTDKD